MGEGGGEGGGEGRGWGKGEVRNQKQMQNLKIVQSNCLPKLNVNKNEKCQMPMSN